MLRFYNTLTGKKEEFIPLEKGRVRMYTCGPTVYDNPHLGNLRAFVFQDILRRYLIYKGFQLKHVMNYTDVDDKTIRNALEAKVSLRDYTDRYIQAFETDCRLLNLETPEHRVRATDHIEDMSKMIQGLLEKGHAYEAGGSIYFRISSFPNYGRLSGIDVGGMRAGARVDVDEYNKENVRDFVLWKTGKQGEPCWDSPFGCGRPGWHIECSAMSMKYLGEHFDIHTGGTDLVFPHHENEIAQSEALTGKPFVKTWLHAEHLLLNGQKMSKSIGNLFTLRDIIKKGHKPAPVRYLLASVPYRKQLYFTFDALHQATQSVERLRNFQLRLVTDRFPAGEDTDLTRRAQETRKQFEEAMDDDLNTARALGAIFDLIREGNTGMDRSRFRQDNTKAFQETLDAWDRLFDILHDDPKRKQQEADLLAEISPAKTASDERVARAGMPATGMTNAGMTDAEIDAQLKERESARQAGDFAKADRIRGALSKAGIVIEDTKAGARWKRM